MRQSDAEGERRTAKRRNTEAQRTQRSRSMISPAKGAPTFVSLCSLCLCVEAFVSLPRGSSD